MELSWQNRYCHHRSHTDIIYPVNYGYIVLGTTEPLETFTGTIIAIIVTGPPGMMFTVDEIAKAVWFQEQYFKIHIELYEENTI